MMTDVNKAMNFKDGLASNGAIHMAIPTSKGAWNTFIAKIPSLRPFKSGAGRLTYHMCFDKGT